MSVDELNELELAAWHTRRASELLRRVERQEEELERIEAEDPDGHLQLVAGGILGRLSRNRQWSAELAAAHALTAIALRQNGSQGLEAEDRGGSFR